MKRRRLVIIIAAAAAALALAGVGIAQAVGGSSEAPVTGPAAEQAKAAALKAAGGGTVLEVEQQDGDGAGTFEVEVKRPDGSTVEIHLDGQFQQVGSAADDDSGSGVGRRPRRRRRVRQLDRELAEPESRAPARLSPFSHLSLICASDNAPMRVLVVEDDVKMAGLLRRGLGEEGLSADVAGTGDDALWMAASTEYDAIVLDVMLPGANGFDVCRRLRESGVWSPVLMLTARDSVDDRVSGLDAGADDYLTKPFSFAELLARLRALVRRAPVERPSILEVGDLKVDPASRQAWRGDVEISLSTKEFAMLETFMRRPGEVLSRYQLLEHCWDYAYENRSNVVDVYVRYLREKIDRPFGRDSIETVRGAGYRLRRAPATDAG